jgi:hypothetical protein
MPSIRSNVIIAGATALALAACGGAAPIAHPSSAPASAATSGLTSAQGTSTCNDIAAWIPQARNEDTPRFTSQLEADESQAQAAGAQLGQDMSTLDNSLQVENGNALLSVNYQVTGQPDPISGLSQDCQAYGVTLNWTP